MATRSRKTGHIFPHKSWTAEEFDIVFKWLKVPDNRRIWNQSRVGGAELLSRYVSERVKGSYRGVRQIEHKVRDLYKRYNEFINQVQRFLCYLSILNRTSILMATRSRKTGHIFPHKSWTAEEFDIVFKWLKVPDNRRIWNQSRVGGAELLSRYVSERVKGSYRGVRQIEHKVRDLYKRYNEVKRWKDEAKSTGVNENELKTSAGGTRRPFQWYDQCDEVFGDTIAPQISMSTLENSPVIEKSFRRKSAVESDINFSSSNLDDNESHNKPAPPLNSYQKQLPENISREPSSYKSENEKNYMSLGNLLTKNDHNSAHSPFITYQYLPKTSNKDKNVSLFCKSKAYEQHGSMNTAQSSRTNEKNTKASSVSFLSDIPLIEQHKLESLSKTALHGLLQEKKPKPSYKPGEKPLIFKLNKLSKLKISPPKSGSPEITLNTSIPNVRNSPKESGYKTIESYLQREYTYSHQQFPLNPLNDHYQTHQDEQFKTGTIKYQNSYQSSSSVQQRTFSDEIKKNSSINPSQILTVDCRGYIPHQQFQSNSPTSIKQVKGDIQSSNTNISEVFGMYPHRNNYWNCLGSQNTKISPKVAKSSSFEPIAEQPPIIMAENVLNHWELEKITINNQQAIKLEETRSKAKVDELKLELQIVEAKLKLESLKHKK
ncbi:hypothetical protein BB561_001808 [Smittium simulii]|uniref:Uncharacterized protein n=1 Tax=Smittium simulii TaxID=133385 RepID=A0A2T9YSY9_9FUNG|nr:hypothetical protein BB561_001808 [Smittium simulii]